MLYREAGQFKTSYAADQQLFPILQDRVAVLAFLVVAFVGITLVATNYWYSAILIPLLVFSLATIGLNILTGYAGRAIAGVMSLRRTSNNLRLKTDFCKIRLSKLR